MQPYCLVPLLNITTGLQDPAPNWVCDLMSQERGDRASTDQSRGTLPRSQLGSEPQDVSSQQAAGPATPCQTELLGTTATHEAGVEADTDTDTQNERGRLLDIHGHPSPRGGAKVASRRRCTAGGTCQATNPPQPPHCKCQDAGQTCLGLASWGQPASASRLSSRGSSPMADTPHLRA